MAQTQTQTPYQVNASAKVLGEQISFSLKTNTRVLFSDLADLLDRAGLGRQWARNMAKSHAFVRAVREMARAKLVDKVTHTADACTFQVSSRVKLANGFDYQCDAIVTLDKTTGGIACSDSAVKAHVEALLTKQAGERRTSDVTRLVRRILEQHRNKTVFPMGGNVYFVDQAQMVLVDQVEAFLGSIGGTMTRWVIVDGADRNVTQTQTVVVDSFLASISEVEEHIAGLNSQATDRVVENSRKKLQEIMQDLEWNEARIGQQKGRLEDYLAQCEALLARQTAGPDVISLPWKESDCDGVDDGEDLPEGAIRLPLSVPNVDSEEMA